MNTANDSHLEGQKPFEDLAEQKDKDLEPKKDEALAALEAQVQSERNARMEERFVWIVICVILIDVLWFRNASNGTFPIVVLVLELVALLVLARRMKVEDIITLMDKILSSIGQRSGQ